MDYQTWIEQLRKSEEITSVFQQDPRKAREFFPRFVQEQLDSCKGLKTFTVVTPDYQVDFHQDMCGEFHPELRISSRNFRICSENYEGKTVKELAEYAAKRLSRKGASRFLFNTLPDVISLGLSKSDDVWHDHIGHPLKMLLKKI